MNDWWLKVQRAEKHMVDIKQEALRYASGNPYSFTRIRLPDTKKEIRGRFHIIKQPDPMIAVMLGDFIHNLRSALDYVVVACVPKKRRKKAGFPILFDDIFAKDNHGEFVVNDAKLRENFETATEGLHPKARALIMELQPYQLGSNAYHSILGIINRLENADKHRQLIAIGCGGQGFTLRCSIPSLNGAVEFSKLLTTGAFLKDDAVIGYVIPDDSIVLPSNVEVHLSGTAKILVKVPRIGGNRPPDNMLLDDVMDNALLEVRDVLKYLEFFVCSA